MHARQVDEHFFIIFSNYLGILFEASGDWFPHTDSCKFCRIGRAQYSLIFFPKFICDFKKISET